MNNLDDPQLYRGLDKQDMLGHIRSIPAMCRQAWQMASSFVLPEDYSHINKVVVLGMGGSAIGGDLVAGLIEDEAGIPIFLMSNQQDVSSSAESDIMNLFIASLEQSISRAVKAGFSG